MSGIDMRIRLISLVSPRPALTSLPATRSRGYPARRAGERGTRGRVCLFTAHRIRVPHQAPIAHLEIRRRVGGRRPAAGAGPDNTGGGAPAWQLQRQPVQPDRDRHGRGASGLRARSGRAADRGRPTAARSRSATARSPARSASRTSLASSPRSRPRSTSSPARPSSPCDPPRNRWRSCPVRPGSTRPASKPPSSPTFPRPQATRGSSPSATITRATGLAGGRSSSPTVPTSASTHQRRSPSTDQTRCASIPTTCSPAPSTSGR